MRFADYEALKTAADDIDQIGRIRGSSELFGNVHTKRGHWLSSMRRLEDSQLLIRRGHNWETGVITDKGKSFLATSAPPQKRRMKKNPFAGGLGADGGTRFKASLVQTAFLSDGRWNHKLGVTVTKGLHKGLKMRAVTLEEGKTCPTECALRNRCYGGNMPKAKRVAWQGEHTGRAIAAEIVRSGPAMVRLHTLGDFPSGMYVTNIYAALLQSGSSAFGYTHHSPESAIGGGIRALAKHRWERFAIRTSYLHGSRPPIQERSAVIVEKPEQAALHNAVLCPEQQGKVESCAQCGFCWHSQRPVAFVIHGNDP